MMKRLFIFSFIFLIFSCDDNGIPSDELPKAIEDRETLAEIIDLKAYLDVEQLGESLDSGYVFMLELMESQDPQFLHVSNDQLVCIFLNEQMMYGSTAVTNCAGLGYFYRYLYNGFKGGNYRMHVTISGKIKEKFSSDIFTGEPFLLENIIKISSCPISFETKAINPSLDNNFWRLQGFINENGELYSYPTCEDPEIGIFFYDNLVIGTPLEEPEAKTFDIRTAVETRLPQLFNVYFIEEDGKIKISMAVNPSWMPPRPATSPTDNFPRLTVDIKNKYDSLNLLLKAHDEIDYAITHNILELFNPETQIRARFF
jgi:hypothetical protein